MEAYISPALIVAGIAFLWKVQDRRFDSIDKRFDSIDKHFDSIERQISDLRTDIRRLNDRLDQHLEGHAPKVAPEPMKSS